ncbi:MAG TPA: translation elongation factor Ts [Gemmatimonadales bacterium]|nr:translation elongation factor Ts [Gemmatimonadales bacterium]
MASTTISPKDVSELRTRTGAGMMDCKRALEESGGDLGKASEILRLKGMAKAEKRAGRNASEGLVVSYIHHNNQVGVLLELNCETDFVARTDEFGALAREIALHIASADPIGVNPDDIPADLLERERRIAEEQVAKEGKPENIRGKIVDGKLKKFVAERTLTEQPFVKDDSRTVGQLLKEASAKLGEAISVRRFARFKIGEV